MRYVALLFIVFAFAAFPLALYADIASSTNFKIETGVVDTGGSRASSTNFGANSSIGEPATGLSSSTSFLLKGGFLYFPAGAALPTATSGAPTAPPGGNLGFIPGGAPAPPTPPEVTRICDFSGDGRCDIVDLSIMLFFFRKTGAEVARYDLNGNDQVDFPDVSVLMFYWTPSEIG